MREFAFMNGVLFKICGASLILSNSSSYDLTEDLKQVRPADANPPHGSVGIVQILSTESIYKYPTRAARRR